MSKIKIEDIVEYDGFWHKGDKDGNCEQFTMVDLKELLAQQKEEIKKVVEGKELKYGTTDYSQKVLIDRHNQVIFDILKAIEKL